MRLIICDDHRVFSDALATMLTAAGHEVPCCPATPEEAAEVLGREEVDVCLMDLGFPGTGEVDGVTQVLRVRPGLVVVVLTASRDAVVLERARTMGARGVALKTDGFAEIERVIAAAAGEGGDRRTTWSASARATVRRRDDHTLARFLTPREWEILSRLAAGESTATMAAAMGVQPSTARTHVDAVLAKLGVHSRLEAVAYAVREGLVDAGGTSTTSRRP